MVNEINNGEGDPISSRTSVPPLRDYRAALAGGKKQDLASQILKDQVARSFDIKRSQLSLSEISERKQRAERGALNSSECMERAGLEQGSVPIALWSSADWALFSQAEIARIGNKQFLESASRTPNSIYIVEQTAGDFSYLFHDEASLQRNRRLVDQALWECWTRLMGESDEIKSPADLCRVVTRKTLQITASVARPALRLQILGPEATVARFFARLDSTPYLNAWPLSPTRQVAFSITHNPRKVVVRVRAHPRELDVSAAHLAFLLRYRLATDNEDSEMLSFSEESCSTTVNFTLQAGTIPRTLLERPALRLVSGEEVRLTFPDGPLSCSHCLHLDHRSQDCPTKPPPPARRQCGLCSQTGHFGLPCPSLRKERRCFFCDCVGHVLAQCPELECRYCHQKGHKVRDCSQAAAAREARKSARAAPPSAPSKAARRTVVSPPEQQRGPNAAEAGGQTVPPSAAEGPADPVSRASSAGTADVALVAAAVGTMPGVGAGLQAGDRSSGSAEVGVAAGRRAGEGTAVRSGVGVAALTAAGASIGGGSPAGGAKNGRGRGGGAAGAAVTAFASTRIDPVAGVGGAAEQGAATAVRSGSRTASSAVVSSRAGSVQSRAGRAGMVEGVSAGAGATMDKIPPAQALAMHNISSTPLYPLPPYPPGVESLPSPSLSSSASKRQRSTVLEATKEAGEPAVVGQDVSQGSRTMAEIDMTGAESASALEDSVSDNDSELSTGMATERPPGDGEASDF